MQWIPADKAPPSEYQSSAMSIVPLLLSLSDDMDHYPYAVKGRYVGGHLNSWFIEGSPSEVHPKFWMPCPMTAPPGWTAAEDTQDRDIIRTPSGTLRVLSSESPGVSAGTVTLRQQIQMIDSTIEVTRQTLSRLGPKERKPHASYLAELEAIRSSLLFLADHMVLLHRLDRIKF